MKKDSLGRRTHFSHNSMQPESKIRHIQRKRERSRWAFLLYNFYSQLRRRVRSSNLLGELRWAFNGNGPEMKHWHVLPPQQNEIEAGASNSSIQIMKRNSPVWKRWKMGAWKPAVCAGMLCIPSASFCLASTKLFLPNAIFFIHARVCLSSRWNFARRVTAAFYGFSSWPLK